MQMGKCVLMDHGVNVRVVQCLVDKHNIIVLAEIMRPSLVFAVYLFAKCIIRYNI